MFNDPTTLTVWISIFFVVAAASVAFAVVALTTALRQSRPAGTRVAADTVVARPVRIAGPSRHAA